MTGVLIVIDGIDGAGKTTQVSMLQDRLQEAGLSVLTSKEPTTGSWGQKIRATAYGERMSVEDEVAAFIEDRKEHLATKVVPALDAGAVVILDRYYYSTLAYQGLRIDDIAPLVEPVTTAARRPDLGIVLDCDPRLAVGRIIDRDGKQNSFESTEDLTKIRAIFSGLVASNSEMRTVPSAGSIESIHAEVLALVLDGPLRSMLCSKSYPCDDAYHCSFRMNGECDWWNVRNAFHPVLQHTHPYALREASSLG